tara:strand:- start:5361 stop:5813 length:453 start_codon:yes stop_codon:yes gene_type:complete
MEKENFSVLDLEKHKTKDINDSHINGELAVVWRNWDNLINNPEMIYVNSVNPREIKGPHIHKKRTSYFYCISGKMVIIVRDGDGEYHEIDTDSSESKLICIPNQIAAAIVNPSDRISKILVMADIAWRPNDDEMINTEFHGYNWEKWKKE